VSSTIFVWHFPNGTQGTTNRIGAIVREIRTRELYVPLDRSCASLRMEWRTLRLVTIRGRDYVVSEAESNFGDERKGDLSVRLASDDPIPHELGSRRENVSREHALAMIR
jgi:hypothetical protein